MARYDRIGHGYAKIRRSEPRIAARIDAALGECRSVVNVGAGTGSYEPAGRDVVAVEPSSVMIRQRGDDASPAVRASGVALPFRDRSFDASLAVLTLHHWPDVAAGAAELARVARDRTLVLTYDTSVGGFWLMDYFPEILALDAASMPSLDALRRSLGRVETHDVPVPHDCIDGFLGAHWRRPEAYLREDVRSATSVFARIQDVESGVERLRHDLASGEWERRYGSLLERSELDVGYRLLVARTAA